MSAAGMYFLRGASAIDQLFEKWGFVRKFGKVWRRIEVSQWGPGEKSHYELRAIRKLYYSDANGKKQYWFK